MTRRMALGFTAVLILLGAGWGLTMPLTKIAVSTGYQHFGLLFWQLAIGAVVMSVIAAVRRVRLPLRRAQLRVYVIIALIGSVLPNSASYQAAVHLPSGIMSILLSMIPIWAFPIALSLGLDRFEWRRFGGICVGLAAVMLIVLPNASISGGIPILWVCVGLISGLFYAFEGNYVARWGTAGLDAIQVLWGASIVGAVIALPLALFSGQWIGPRLPLGSPETALVLSATTHVLVYAGYVWLVGRAGPVFAVQVSFLVTLCGVFWARLILSEDYAPTVWIALILMLLGMFLVQPRRSRVEDPASFGESVR
ncbi:DMT family transporter [Tateyamaria omphalii]|uniref:EamA family transporter n=1 Tax=Tateyamaria omphalii TaxID=299262 RepID=A0A1P8MSG4_9RHOB|nr:DMT family transporter [Tateyamaria omphalii]APX10952.1 EamA family transporter [Tateyamaria omphalii]